MYNNYCLPKSLFLFHQFELMSAVGVVVYIKATKKKAITHSNGSNEYISCINILGFQLVICSFNSFAIWPIVKIQSKAFPPSVI